MNDAANDEIEGMPVSTTAFLFITATVLAGTGLSAYLITLLVERLAS